MASAAAGPWGGPAFADVVSRLRRGWPAGLTVLTGDDLYHLDRAQEALLDHLVPDRSDAFAWTVLGDAPVTAGALVGAARASGMFARRRVVLLRDVAALEGEPDPLAAYAAAPPRESFLLVRAPKLDRKRKLHKTLAGAGTCLTFRGPAGDAESAAFEKEVARIAAERGVTLAPPAVTLLVAVAGTDLWRIVHEIDKLAIWAGPDGAHGSIDAPAVRGLIAGSALLSGWELADALLARDRPRALASARRLVDAGEEPIRVLGGLAYRVRALVQAKGLAARGTGFEGVLRAVRGAWYFRDALRQGVSRYDLDEALAMPGRLLAADRAFKSRAIDNGAVLEALVADLTAPPGGEAR